ARIESDYGMTISFEPKEGLMAGTFDIERTEQKTPEERAKFAAAIETEFVPPPAEDEEEIEETGDVEEVEAVDERETAPLPHKDGDQTQTGSSSKRRRRRRGGRGRNGGRS